MTNCISTVLVSAVCGQCAGRGNEADDEVILCINHGN